MVVVNTDPGRFYSPVGFTPWRLSAWRAAIRLAATRRLGIKLGHGRGILSSSAEEDDMAVEGVEL